MRHTYRAAEPTRPVRAPAQSPNGACGRQTRHRSRAQHGSRNKRMRDERMSTTPRCTTKEPFSLERNAAGRLVLTKASGEPHVGVEPIRTFPISDPDRFISLVDSHAHELLCIADLAELPP